MTSTDGKLPRRLMATGIALLIVTFGLAIAACWTHGDVPARLGGTAFTIGIAGAFLAMVGFTNLEDE